MYKKHLSLILLVGLLAACHRTARPVSFMNTPITVPVFENNTPQPLLVSPLTTLFKETLNQRFLIVQNANEAEWILNGTIHQIEETPRSLSAEGTGFVYRVTLRVTYHLDPKDNGTPIRWEDTADAHWVTRIPDLIQDRTERDRALRQIFIELSHRAANQIQEIILSKNQASHSTGKS